MSTTTAKRLKRTPEDTPPVRIAHVGLGAFARSHQAWYTERANQVTGDPWGIAGFTGRTSVVADVLGRQDGLYHLVTRSADADEFELIRSVASALDGGDLAAFTDTVASPSVSIVTVTVSEAGYRYGPDGLINAEAPGVQEDLRTLGGLLARPDHGLAEEVAGARLTSTPARLLLALDARRRRGAGGLTVVPCDNISENGSSFERLMLDLAGRCSAELREWVAASVSFVDTSIDRITPATTRQDSALVESRTGFEDNAPVVTEPFHDWVLSGEFRSGRPDWQLAGARFVDDIEPFERRKLWLLNGSHSLLAYAGQLAGWNTVEEAITDPRLRNWVEELWDEAAAALAHPGLELDSYRAALVERFENPRIRHSLRQISAEGSSKMRLRIVPVLLAGRDDGRAVPAATRALACWVTYLLTADSLLDAQSPALNAARVQGLDAAISGILEIADPRLTGDDELVRDVRREVRDLTGLLQGARR
jgi:fructuronate reductase